MSLKAVIVGFMIFTPGLGSGSVPGTFTYSNITSASSTSSPSPITLDCCFVVQDTITEQWWQEYVTEPPTYQVVGLTSITTFVTPYIDTTVTNYETNVYTTNVSYTQIDSVGINPAGLLLNNAPQPAEVIASLNGSQIVTAGVTIQSPTAFWVYSTVKVIAAAAVTDSKGQVVCATTSIAASTTVITSPADPQDSQPASTVTETFDRPGQIDVPSDIFTISGVNSNAEAYFGGYNIGGFGYTYVPNGSSTTVSAITITNNINSLTTQALSVYPVLIESTVLLNIDGSTIYTNAPKPSGVIITFPTPYIYFPTRGATGASGDADICLETGGNENYGYVPQSVIDYMTGIPAISSQYPGLASCLPGGPSIIYQILCAGVAPTTQGVAADLTSYTVITVSSSGFFNPPPISNHIPTGVTVIPGSTIVPVNPLLPFLGSTTVISGTSFMIIPGATTVPLPGSAPPSLPDSITVVSGQSSDVIPSPTSVPDNPAFPFSGRTTIISGTTFAIVTSPTTIPVNPAFPFSGSTTTISGTPFVVITGPTTVPIPPNSASSLPPLSDSTTLISGTPVVILSGPQTIALNSEFSVSGLTTVIGGITEVVVSGTQTVTLSPTGMGTGAAGLSSGLAQVTGGAAERRKGQGWWWGLSVSVFCLLMLNIV